MADENCVQIWYTISMRNIKGKNNPNWKGGKIEKLCLFCGKRIYIIPAYEKRNGGKFCSTRCHGKHKTKIKIKSTLKQKINKETMRNL